MTHSPNSDIEHDYSAAQALDYEPLALDTVPVRSMLAEDLPYLIRIDQRITGRDRAGYYRSKVAEALDESGVRVSLVAELDGSVVGFIMARVDFGEFGRAEPEAVIDTIGVQPGFRHRQIGLALVTQLMGNLAALRVERVRTEVSWNEFSLLAFLDRCGFRPTARLAFSRRIG